MIYTVTFNPSLDYIVSVDDFKLGLTNRTSSELMLPGGKGINVSRDGKHYVLEIRPETNEVVVGRNKDLFSTELIATDFNWISGETPEKPLKVCGRTRYHQALTEGIAEVLENGNVRIVFDEPIRAITKGQSVVLYDGEVVLGGGTIVQAGSAI